MTPRTLSVDAIRGRMRRKSLFLHRTRSLRDRMNLGPWHVSNERNIVIASHWSLPEIAAWAEVLGPGEAAPDV